jgi:hypothetical protein
MPNRVEVGLQFSGWTRAAPAMAELQRTHYGADVGVLGIVMYLPTLLEGRFCTSVLNLEILIKKLFIMFK